WWGGWGCGGAGGWCPPARFRGGGGRGGGLFLFLGWAGGFLHPPITLRRGHLALAVRPHLPEPLLSRAGGAEHRGGRVHHTAVYHHDHANHVPEQRRVPFPSCLLVGVRRHQPPGAVGEVDPRESCWRRTVTGQESDDCGAGTRAEDDHPVLPAVGGLVTPGTETPQRSGRVHLREPEPADLAGPHPGETLQIHHRSLVAVQEWEGGRDLSGIDGLDGLALPLPCPVRAR